MHFSWLNKEFNQLSLTELYSLIQLREQIFVVEQQAIYLDADGLDLTAWHVLVYDGDQLIGCARILTQDLMNGHIHFGRVCVVAKYRKSGLGRQLVEYIITHIYARYGADIQISIAAQQYLVSFYQSCGFIVDGEGYVTEDGIPHIDMKYVY